MNPVSGGIWRLASCFTASLLFHLALIVAVIAVTWRENAIDQGVMHLSVEFVEPPVVSALSPKAIMAQKARPVGAPHTVPSGPMTTAPAGVMSKQKDPEGGPLSPVQSLPSQAAPAAQAGGTQPNMAAMPAPGGTVQLIEGTGRKKPGEIAGGGGTVTTSDRHGEGLGGPVGRGTYHAAGGDARSSQLAAYQSLLKRIIEAHKEYPLAARKSRCEGSCQRRFTIGRDGSLKKVEPLSSCGHPFLDDAATSAITTVGTFPPLPADFKGEEALFTVTITFTLAKE